MAPQLHTRFPREPLASGIVVFTRQVRSALRQAAVNTHPANVIIRTLCAELLQWDECCHLTVPAGTRVSLTANLIIRQCASSKKSFPSGCTPALVRRRSEQRPLSELSIGTFGSVTLACGEFSGTDEPRGRDSRNGWCLLNQLEFGKQNTSVPGDENGKDSAASIQPVGETFITTVLQR